MRPSSLPAKLLPIAFLAATIIMLTFPMSRAEGAQLTARFDEGAPKDRFTITNTGACTLSGARVVIDLSGSKAGLIFDVTDAGAGVEVFQPFDLVQGAAFVEGRPAVRDGDTSVVLPLRGLPAGESIAFTIDVDDTLGGREITVDGSEIEGAQVRLDDRSAPFGRDARARLPLPGCS